MGVADPVTHSSKCTRVSCSPRTADTFIVDRRMSTTVFRDPDSCSQKKKEKKGKTGAVGSDRKIYRSSSHRTHRSAATSFYLYPPPTYVWHDENKRAWLVSSSMIFNEWTETIITIYRVWEIVRYARILLSRAQWSPFSRQVFADFFLFNYSPLFFRVIRIKKLRNR